MLKFWIESNALSARRERDQSGPGCARGRNPNCQRGCRQGSHAGRKGRIQAGRDGVHACRGFTRIPKLVIDLDELDLWEFFKACHQRACDVIERAVRLAATRQVNIHPTILELDFSVACKTVVDHGETPVPFHVTGTLEELVEDRIDDILGTRNKTLYRDLVGELTGDQPLIICEVKSDLHVHWRACG